MTIQRLRGGRLAVLALVLVVGCGSPGFYDPPSAGGPSPSAQLPGASPLGPTPTPAPADPAATLWQRVVAGVERDGTVPLETALLAFSLAVGPLPGVSVPDGEVGFIGSGTAAVRWLLRHWDGLTAEQRAEVERLLGPAGAARPVQPIAAVGVPPGPLGSGNDAPLEDFQAEAKRQEEAIAAKLGRKMRVPIDVESVNFEVQQGTKEYARTVPLDAAGRVLASGEMKRCKIQIGPLGMQLESVDMTSVVAHEVFHCFQFSLAYDNVARALKVAGWLAEGSAAWVGEDAVAAFGGSTIVGQYWEGWLKSPMTELFERSYDSIGFFTHLKKHKLDPWQGVKGKVSLLDQMHKAGEKDSAAAYLVAAKSPGAQAFIDAWAPSYFRTGPAPAWEMDVPPTMTGISTPIDKTTIANGESYVAGVEPLAAYAFEMESTAEVFVLKGYKAKGHGLVRFADGTEVKLSDAVGQPFCMKPGGCVCPGGSGHSYRNVASGKVMIGLSGHTDGLNLHIDGVTSGEACSSDPGDFFFPEPCHCPEGPLGLRLPSDRLEAQAPRRRG